MTDATIEKPLVPGARQTLEVEHLCDWSIELEPPQLISTPTGNRVTYVLKHGTSEGERLRGEFLPGGGDWIVFGSDGIGRLDIRATLRTHDDELIHVTSTGVADFPPESMERLQAGKTIAWEDTYLRSTPRFEASTDGAYAWVNSAVCVGINAFGPNHVLYSVYRLR